jgi:LacI family gluconate utilization system Gnt-I transcriptional repressor
MRGQATMADVGRLAEVSAMTVSRALRDPTLVSTDTYSRILGAMEQLNYVPNKVAGSLRTQRSDLVAAIVPSLQNSLFSATLQGLSDGLEGTGLKLVVASTGFGEQPAAALARELLALRPCGLVIYEPLDDPQMLQALADSRTPVITVGDLVPPTSGPVVSYSNRLAAKALAEHLLQRGRRRIGVVILPLTRSARSVARLAGYKEALRKFGQPFDPELVQESEGGFANAAAAFQKLLASKPRIDAVIGMGDVFAAGAFLAAQRLGIACPGDVAIASFDDSDLLTQLQPQVTALKLPRYEIGLEASRRIASPERQEREPRKVDLGFSLLERAST